MNQGSRQLLEFSSSYFEYKQQNAFNHFIQPYGRLIQLFFSHLINILLPCNKKSRMAVVYKDIF
jgi:hypothetical protein